MTTTGDDITRSLEEHYKATICDRGSPVEVLAFCLSELSTEVKIDHAYKRFATGVYRAQCLGGA